MQPYIILQYPYETIDIALCNQGQILATIQEHKFNAIKSIIPNIQKLLTDHNLTLQDLKFIGVNVGPGPYNTLRALLTMANGIHFAAKTPLISLSALDLLHTECPDQDSLVILQAFADHVFYSLKIGISIEQKACSINDLMEKITGKTLTVLGNGAQLYREKLEHVQAHLIFPEPMILFNSVPTLAQQALKKYQTQQIEPNYLKPIYFEDLL